MIMIHSYLSNLLSPKELKLLKSLIGKKLIYIHHQNRQFKDLTFYKVGLNIEDSFYSIYADYRKNDFINGSSLKLV